MTSLQNSGNAFGRQTNVRRNLDKLVAPGVYADRIARNIQNIGIVKVGTRRITATSYIADVDVTTQYGGTTVTIPGVRFNVPVAEGDVVSLEIIGGIPLNGVFGTPIRPQGPNVLYFDGPASGAEWTTDESAPENRRSTNATYGAYVLPITGGGGVNTPYNTSGIATLLTLPKTLTIRTTPAAAYIEVAAQLHGGLKIVGGPRAGDYAVRLPTARIYANAYYTDPEGGYIASTADTHHGLESARGSGPSIGSHTDKLNNPLRSNGEHLLFARTISFNPVAVGNDFTIALLMPVQRRTNFEWFHQITHPEYDASSAYPYRGKPSCV